MKIVFNGLGTKDTVLIKNKIYGNGAIVDVPDEQANAYINVGLAFEVKTEADKNEALAVQKLEIKNTETREKIQNKVKEKGGGVNVK